LIGRAIVPNYALFNGPASSAAPNYRPSEKADLKLRRPERS
jgi:hypothetical protein